jgi:hypothetical protein
VGPFLDRQKASHLSRLDPKFALLVAALDSRTIARVICIELLARNNLVFLDHSFERAIME